jgi:hypothetical protein
VRPTTSDSLRARLQDRRLRRLQGGGPARRTPSCSSRSWPSRCARPRVHGRRHRRHQLPPRAHAVHGRRVRGEERQGHGPAVRDVRLRGRPPSRTQGRAVYTMQFDSYAEVPRNVADEIVKKIRGE